MAWPSILEPIKKIIAVVGCQRSGTTVLGQLLGASRTALLVDEFDGLYPWFRAVWRRPDDAAIETANVLRNAGLKYKDARVSANTTSLARIDTLILKAPNLTYDPDVLASLPVPVIVVYPLRDPRAVVASMARLKEIDFVGNQLKLIEERPRVADRYKHERARMADPSEPMWIRQAILWQIKTGRSSEFEQAGLRVHSFRYEEMVEQPEDILGPVLEACGLPVLGSLSSHDVYIGRGPGGTDRTRGLDATSLGRWRETLDAFEASGVLAEAQPLAAHLGYA